MVKECFNSTGPLYLEKYMSAVYQLEYTEKPLYKQLKKLFSDHLGSHDPTKTLEWLPAVAPSKVRGRFTQIVRNWIVWP